MNLLVDAQQPETFTPSASVEAIPTPARAVRVFFKSPVVERGALELDRRVVQTARPILPVLPQAGLDECEAADDVSQFLRQAKERGRSAVRDKSERACA